MGKADKGDAKASGNRAYDVGNTEFSNGIAESQGRVSKLTERSDNERDSIMKAYQNFGTKGAEGYLGGLSNPVLMNNSTASGGSGGSGGGDNIVKMAPGDYQNNTTNPSAPGMSAPDDYVGVWKELMAKNGGFDPERLKGIYGDADKLREFAKTGGISDTDRANVNRQSLLDFEKTGGYSADDISNIRNRSNRSVPAYYQNLQDSMNRRGAGQVGGPGMDRTGFKMARMAGQQQADTARDTELGISDAVRSGKMDAAKFLSGQNLELANLGSRNTLEGYKGASGIDTNIGDSINRARGGAAGAMAQNERASEANNNARNAAGAALSSAEKRWAAEMAQRDQMFGASGMNDMYSSRPEELLYNQGQLADYRNNLTQNAWNHTDRTIARGSMPGWTDAFKNFGQGMEGISSMWKVA